MGRMVIAALYLPACGFTEYVEYIDVADLSSTPGSCGPAGPDSPRSTSGDELPLRHDRPCHRRRRDECGLHAIAAGAAGAAKLCRGLVVSCSTQPGELRRARFLCTVAGFHWGSL